jgi:hypothetical protein
VKKKTNKEGFPSVMGDVNLMMGDVMGDKRTPDAPDDVEKIIYDAPIIDIKSVFWCQVFGHHFWISVLLSVLSLRSSSYKWCLKLQKERELYKKP